MAQNMTDELAQALHSLTTNERKAVLLQVKPLTGSVAFERLLRGVASEVRALDERDARVLEALANPADDPSPREGSAT